MIPIRWRMFSPSRLAPLVLVALMVWGTTLASAKEPQRFTFFQGTQYPLTVHFLKGELPGGPTVMVQGGIQGDEVSGYVTAQILTLAHLKKGNLIIIPRANVPTVLARKRQINVDLNRRFDQDYNSFFEDRLARAIRFLVSKSDAFIHLHEGSGFYHPVYVDNLRNPRRYGQSIIIDTPVFQDRIDLAKVANSVLKKLNQSIEPDRRFRLFNTNTFASNTTHPEQRKSLTYHALSTAGIPALAIEVSKNISNLGWKVLHQLRATTLTLEEYGLELTLPELSQEEINRYAGLASPVTVNGVTLAPGETKNLALPPGGRVDVGTLEGLSTTFDPVPAVFASDRPHVNMVAAPRLALNRFRRLEVRADGVRVGRLDVNWNQRWDVAGPAVAPAKTLAPLFACWLNGKLRFVPAGGILDAVEGDQLVLEGVWGPPSEPSEVLNLKGYVSQRGVNDGQDAGQEIVLDPDAFIARYLKPAPKGVGMDCSVVRETPGEKRTSFTIRIKPRKVQALRLGSSRGAVMVPFVSGSNISLTPGTYRLDDLWCNGPRDKILATVGNDVTPWGAELDLRSGSPLIVTLRQATTFRPIGSMTLSAVQ